MSRQSKRYRQSTLREADIEAYNSVEYSTTLKASQLMIAAISHVVNSNVLPVWSEVFANVTSGENSKQHCSCLHFSASLTNSQAQNNFVSDFCTSLNHCWVVLGVTYGCDESFLIVRPWLSRGRVEEGFFLLKSRISHRFRLKGLCSHHCIVTRLRRFVSPLKLLPETKTSSQTRVTKKKLLV